MKKQLKLPEQTLIELGFKEAVYHDPETGNSKRTFEIQGNANDKIYYNPDENIYIWYYKTTIGDNANHINLDITEAASLLMVMQAFKIAFNF